MTDDESTELFMRPLEEHESWNVDRRRKLVSLEEAGRIIASKERLSVSGSHSADAPMALVRAAIRAGATDMTLVPPAATSIAADLPIAAGMLSKVYLSYIGFQSMGLAPGLREAAENGRIEVVEADEPFVILGTQAAAGGRPFATVRHVYDGTDLPELNDELETVIDPFTGEEVYAIPALETDVFLVHVQACDPYGNAQIWGGSGGEREQAKAADLVIVQADEIVDLEVVRQNTQKTTIPGAWVDHVVHAPYGAHPTYSSANYAIDEEHMKEYVTTVKNDNAEEYIRQYVMDPVDHIDYLDRVGGLERMIDLRGMMTAPNTFTEGGQ